MAKTRSVKDKDGETRDGDGRDGDGRDGDGREGALLMRRIAELDGNLEQALVAAEDAHEQARLLAEDRAGMVKELEAQRRRIAELNQRLAEVEAERERERQTSLGTDLRLRTVRQQESDLAEELQTSYEELRAMAEELERANAALAQNNLTLERRVEERNAELIEANAALRAREEQLRLAQKSANAGSWDWDVNANQVTWSPECYELIGLDAKHERPSMERLMSILLPEDLDALHRLRESTEAGAEDEFRVEFRIRHPRRGLRWIASQGRVVWRDLDGRPSRISGLAFDVTERKELEHGLRKAKEAAEKADRAKTRFLAAASHDLRQPIQAAALYAYVLRAYIGTDRNAVETLDLLRASIDNLNGMLNGLLDLSRLEAGAVEIAVTDFSPDTLMERLTAEYSGMATGSGVELRCVPSSLPVCTDPHLLERVLRNLLSNAITHGAPGAEVETPGRVLMGCRMRGHKVEFQVWDGGPGIPEEARGTIFEEFRQLKNPERNAAQGFGLGLAIVARIARLLGLEVTVRSQVGRGSVFAVTVPRAPARAPQPIGLPAPDGAESAAAWLKGRTVLLVEDDERVRTALTLMLKRWGVRVVAVASTAELAAKLPRLRIRPHVVLTDYRLPGGDTGRTVMEQVRRRWDVPGVIISGDTAPERLQDAKSIGCPLLHKPVAPADLARVLGEAMDVRGGVRGRA